MKKKIIIPAITILTAGALFFGINSTLAQTEDGQTFASKLAAKLGLEESKVKSALDELHEERHTVMEQKAEERLSQLVTEGKLTKEQKDKILAKQKELYQMHDENKDELKDKTPQERKELMNKKREELEAWAKENGIDIKYLLNPLRGHGGMKWKLKYN